MPGWPVGTTAVVFSHHRGPFHSEQCPSEGLRRNGASPGIYSVGRCAGPPRCRAQRAGRVQVSMRQRWRGTPNVACARAPGSADLQIGSVRLTLRPSATTVRIRVANVQWSCRPRERSKPIWRSAVPGTDPRTLVRSFLLRAFLAIATPGARGAPGAVTGEWLKPR
jgi:hypothetical protein